MVHLHPLEPSLRPLQLPSSVESLPRMLFLLIVVALTLGIGSARAAGLADCTSGASDACIQTFSPPGTSLSVHYYASAAAGSGAPKDVLIVMHGHPHDANKTFDAGLAAARADQKLASTLVVSPLLQVDSAHASRCSTPGVPEAEPGDLTWTCSSWMDGEPATNDAHITSFAALDALINDVLTRWPGVKRITFAGFSAGAQVVQHYIAFSAAPPAGVSLRFVVADPGTWLYFDPVRPVVDSSASCQKTTDPSRCAIGFARPDASSCANYDQWKYGIASLPASLAAAGVTARARYALADISYLEGELDSSDGPGRAAKLLDRSCSANLEGSYRLQRGQAYTAYDAQILSPAKPHLLSIVPGCAHDVSCVFPSALGRAALFAAPSVHEGT